MYLKYFFIILIICYIKSLDTDCLPDSGQKVEECRKFTTFVQSNDDNFKIENNTLYLCCYLDTSINGMNYKGCYPVKEETYFSNIPPFEFQCYNPYLMTTKVMFLFSFLYLLL